jgi:D-alanyl-D-alanine carboxypeptidase
MKQTLIILLLFAFSVRSHAQTGDNQKYINQIDSLLNTLVTSKKSAGIMVGIQVNGAAPHFKEFGVGNISTMQQVNSNSLFRIASVTKTITSAAIMSLVEKGKLKLTDKISKFFKDFPKADSITIYQLLSHTSGIPNWWEGGMPADEPKDFPMCKNPHLYLQRMKTPSFFSPGTKHYYSNSGFVLLGEIIEMVSGIGYEDYLKKNIFDKAGMQNTFVEKKDNSNTNYVKGYKQNSPTDTSFSDPDVYAMPFAAGALRSNSKDMLKFLEALYNGKFIKKSNVKLITSYASTTTGVPVYDAMFFPGNFTPPPPPGHIKKYGYGLGFSLMEIYNTPVVWHSGGIAGFNSILMYIPKTKTGIILLSNTENGLMPVWEDLQKLFVKIK